MYNELDVVKKQVIAHVMDEVENLGFSAANVTNITRRNKLPNDVLVAREIQRIKNLIIDAATRGTNEIIVYFDNTPLAEVTEYFEKRGFKIKDFIPHMVGRPVVRISWLS